MNEYTIKLDEDEIEIVGGLLNSGSFDSTAIEDALLGETTLIRDILTQILEQHP